MSKVIVATVIALLVLLAACGGKQMSAKPLTSTTPTANVVHSTTPAAAPKPVTPPAKTAAEALKELQSQQVQSVAASAVKSGTTTFYGPANATAKNKGDARKLLIARTRAAFQAGQNVSIAVKATTTSGAHYYTNSGSAINLPSNYRAASHND
jgi:hypothetical protein